MSNELKIERVLGAPRDAVWRCWTESELLKRWYCPLPWRVTQADLDLRAGGRSNIVMEGPNGERHDAKGCYLEVVPKYRLVFTDALLEGFMPVGTPFMVGYVELADAPGGATTMVWGARHWSDADRQKHLDMGFEQGWGIAADQLDALTQDVAAGRIDA